MKTRDITPWGPSCPWPMQMGDEGPIVDLLTETTMTNPFDPTPTVNAKYGAPMGRPSHDTFTDKRGNTFKLVVNDDAKPFRLIRCPLDSGGYDRGGAYWGLGEPLYYYEGPLSDINGFVRGATREKAKAAVRKLHPKARFYQ